MKPLFAAIVLSAALLTQSAFAAPATKKQEVKATDFSREMTQMMINQSIQRFKINDDVSAEDAIEAMKSRAIELNFKEVADLPLSKEVAAKRAALGDKRPVNYMRILAFCDSLIANEIVSYDSSHVIYAGFLPCRIALIQDKKNDYYLVTLNMDMMLHAVDLPHELKKLATKVRDNIYSIVEAGVNGDF